MGGPPCVRSQDILYTLLSGHPLHSKLVPALFLSHNVWRLVKQKWALLESNPPRNSQSGTHRVRERGSGCEAAPSAISIDSRIP
jgi:hypothetical protein